MNCITEVTNGQSQPIPFAVPHSEKLRTLLRMLDGVGNALAENIEVDTDGDLDIAKVIMEVQQWLAQETNNYMNLNRELDFVFSNVPKASTISASLPTNALPFLSTVFGDCTFLEGSRAVLY